MASSFQFKNAALMMALAAAYPIHAYAAAGTALFSTGDVTVRRGAANDPLARGGSVESGDTILTGPAGRAQLRFSDGGLVALQPNSQFNIQRYADANDPKQDAFLVDLLRGGMRAITGLIGKRNHDNYKVTTTTATIGIRGSAFLMSYLPDGTLVVTTEQDAIVVCTTAGCAGLAAGESVRVISATQEPVRTSTRATIPVPDPLRIPSVVGDGVTTAGNSNLVTKPAAPPPAPAPGPTNVLTGMAFASAGLRPNSDNPPDQRQYLNGSLVLNPSTGTPSSYLAQNNDQGSVTGTTAIVASTGSYATKDLLTLGTWSADSWTLGSGGVGNGTAASTNLATGFVTGLPTPASALSSLSGMTGQYTLASATPVYASNGSVGSVTAGTLAVDFLGAGNFANLNLTVTMPAAQPLAAAAALITTPTADNTVYTLSGAANSTGAGIAGGLSVSTAACLAGQANCGTGYFSGFLSGPNAAKAGVSFTANGTAYGNFGGAATFAQSSVGQTALRNDPTFFTTLYPMVGSSTSALSYGYSGSYSLSAGEGTTAQFTGNQLTGFANSGAGNGQTSVVQTGTGSSSYGAVGTPGSANYIGWGYWAGATTSNNNSYSPTSQTLANVHYIVTNPIGYNLMPTTGSASYSMVGGTAPTLTSGSTTQTGQLQSASMSVNFGTSAISLNVNTMFGTTPVNISMSGNNTTYTNGLFYYNNSSTFQSCGTTGPTINGVFSGTNAYYAGLSYRTPATVGSLTGNVSGAVVLQQTTSSGLGRALGGTGG